MTKAGQFAVDASIPPGRILRREAEHELADCDGDGRSPGASVGLRPVAGDASAVPSQQGFGGDDPADAARAGERGCDGPEQGPIIVADCRPVDLSA